VQERERGARWRRWQAQMRAGESLGSAHEEYQSSGGFGENRMVRYVSDLDIRRPVRDRYAAHARSGSGCCEPQGSSCCDGGQTAASSAVAVGYTAEQLESLPEGADLGLGCGSPTWPAELAVGETVLDLGAGGGIDCFLAATAVGTEGHVIGVDMTPEMLDRARANAEKGSWDNVEFRLGEIENLPVADSTVDAVLSNCVINLSPDKPRVFREAFRVLKPGGRVIVSDIVLSEALPESVASSFSAYAACVAGASRYDEYLAALSDAGFTGVDVLSEHSYVADAEVLEVAEDAAGVAAISREELGKAAEAVVSITVRAVRPG
jgi:arsenite methyltransferase